MLIAKLNSIPNTKFLIQFYASASPGFAGFGQGQMLVTTVSLKTDGGGNGLVKVTVPQNLFGDYITATATDPSLDTSEFGPAVQVKGAGS
jgi:hypothetical protein